MRTSKGALRTVAVFEAAKGALVLAAGFGVLTFIHRDLAHAADELVRAFHLNPASRYPRIFLHAARSADDARIWLLAAGAMTYALARFVEAYGLWRSRRWAEWLAAAWGGVYIPIELYELARGLTWAKGLLLVVNIAIVAYLIAVLRNERMAARAGAGRAGI